MRDIRSELKSVATRHPRFTIAATVTAFVFILAMILGPIFVAEGVDPRPYVALLPAIYALVLFGGVFWIVSVVLRGERLDRN